MTKVNDETKTVDEERAHRRRRRHSGSLFGPIVLIGIGLALLFNNFGWLQDLNWIAAFQLWPLLLVFLGVNIIVRQAPPPFGTLLSALVGLAAVLAFVYVLLFGESIPALQALPDGELQTERIQFAADGVREADVHIDVGATGAEIVALEDSPNLIEGVVTHRGELSFGHEVNDGQATVHLEAHENFSPIFWMNPANWGGAAGEDAWQIGLQPDIPMTLNLNLGSGPVEMELEQLVLADLAIDGGSGAVTLSLPSGEYDTAYDMGSGSVRMTLPSSGEHTVDMDGGSGALQLLVPTEIPVRIEAEGGSGSFELDERFEQIDGDGADEGVFQTSDYDDQAENRILIILDAGSGSVQVGAP